MGGPQGMKLDGPQGMKVYDSNKVHFLSKAVNFQKDRSHSKRPYTFKMTVNFQENRLCSNEPSTFGTVHFQVLDRSLSGTSVTVRGPMTMLKTY